MPLGYAARLSAIPSIEPQTGNSFIGHFGALPSTRNIGRPDVAGVYGIQKLDARYNL